MTEAPITQATEQFLAQCGRFPPIPIAVVHPVNAIAIEAAADAARRGLIAPALIGPRSR
ncbi:hypothetical protein [Novosphingobium sp.]|uniref:hypothetical protein n=1 Tax=Novosphingobium sp. TaxID=1874826 RepID=UPI0028AFE618|nr:hypothetical protein [Novosphingobium sp.]